MNYFDRWALWPFFLLIWGVGVVQLVFRLREFLFSPDLVEIQGFGGISAKSEGKFEKFGKIELSGIIQWVFQGIFTPYDPLILCHILGAYFLLVWGVGVVKIEPQLLEFSERCFKE